MAGAGSAGPADVKRLFVGTFIAAEQMESLSALAGAAERLRAHWSRKPRFVRANKLHMTWLFLGDVPAESVAAVGSVLTGITSGRQAMEIEYAKAEFWPDERRPRQLVLVPLAVSAEVRALGLAVRQALAPFVARPDRHAFRPHLTIARLEQPHCADAGPVSLPGWLNLAERLPLRHHLGSLTLIESHRGPGADEYRTVLDLPLA